MRLDAELADGDLRLHTLVAADAPLIVEATSTEVAPALWGPRPAGPYTLDDARSALREWDPDSSGQTSYGIFVGGRMVGALGLMRDGSSAAELAYWTRPEERGRGFARRGVQALTAWAHDSLPLTRIWLEINPDNAASRRVAEHAGFELEERLPRHCRAWVRDDPEIDSWHDCDIWVHPCAFRPPAHSPVSPSMDSRSRSA